MSSLETSLPSFTTSPEERFARRLESRLDEVEAAVQDVFEYAQFRVQHLSDNLCHDPEYVLGLMFDRGAFLHLMSRSASRGSSGAGDGIQPDDIRSTELKKEFVREFDNLTSENQRTLSDLLEQNDQSHLAIRSAPSDRAADADILIETVKGLMLLLKCRCGVDGFFCLARNNTAYELPQDWFFSDPDIDAYFITALDGWDKYAISRSLERFSLSASPNRYATWMRGEIKDKIDMLFAKATGRGSAAMDYENYEKAVLIDLGVELVGWTHPTFACPSVLPLEIRPLETLLHAVNVGECYFHRITEAKRARHYRSYIQRLNGGQSSESTKKRYPFGDADAD